MKGEKDLLQWSDEDIILRVRQGDIDAFEWIVARYETTVANLVYGIVGNVAHAEDLGQEVFMRAYRSLKNFKFRSGFKTYLTRIAINVCRDDLRKRQRNSVSTQEQARYEDRVFIDRQEDDDVREVVRAALLQLERDQRMVVVLRMIEGYSTKETAGLLKIPQGTVLSRLSRGMERLKQILGKEFTE